jgi:DNA-dependent RNA polymerase auxiliary subunit epsilon
MIETNQSNQLAKAKLLWAEFANIPIDDEDRIDDQFLDFEKGTDRFEIWHWFEMTFDCSIVTDLMGA